MSDCFFRACCSFFNLEYPSSPNEIDEFWKISRSDIYKGLELAFDKDWKKFLSHLILPHGKSFLEYANEISCNSQVSVAKEVLSIQNHRFLPNIALLGKMKSGKSTITTYLCDKYKYTEYYFAKPLKLGVQQLFSLTDAQLFDVDEKNKVDPRWGVSPRYLFQQIGTDLFRNRLHEYIPQVKSCWIQNFFRWWTQNKSLPVVISDCRFQNEVDAVQMVNIKAYKIIRDKIDKCIIQSNHSSETEQNDVIIDDVIENNSTLLSLYEKIDKIVNPTQEQLDVS